MVVLEPIVPAVALLQHHSESSVSAAVVSPALSEEDELLLMAPQRTHASAGKAKQRAEAKQRHKRERCALHCGVGQSRGVAASVGRRRRPLCEHLSEHSPSHLIIPVVTLPLSPIASSPPQLNLLY